MDDHAQTQIGRGMWRLISAGLIAAGVAVGSGLYDPEPVHPCDEWKARSPTMDLEGCYAAWEVDPWPEDFEAE